MDSEISMTFVSSKWIPGLKAINLDVPFNRGNKMVQTASGIENNCCWRIFVSPRFGLTEKVKYRVVITYRTDGKSEVWLALVFSLLILRADKDVEGMKLPFLQHMEVTSPLD